MNGQRPSKRALTVIGTAAALLVAAAVLVSGALAGTQKMSAVAFHDAMRKLWEDHVTWTRLAIVSLVAGLPDTSATVDRLMKNQADIGDAIRPFYGDAAGDRLTALLKDHIAIAAEIILAAKAGLFLFFFHSYMSCTSFPVPWDSLAAIATRSVSTASSPETRGGRFSRIALRKSSSSRRRGSSFRTWIFCWWCSSGIW